MDVASEAYGGGAAKPRILLMGLRRYEAIPPTRVAVMHPVGATAVSALCVRVRMFVCLFCKQFCTCRCG